MDGLNDLAANLSMNESRAGGSVGAVGPGGTGKPRCANEAGCASMSIKYIGAVGALGASWAGDLIGAGGIGAVGTMGAGGPGRANGAGCASRTGLEDSIRSMSMKEIGGVGALGAIWAGEVIEAGGIGAVGTLGAGGPGRANGTGCASRTGLEDSIRNSAKEVDGASGAEGTIVTPYSGSLFPAYSSKVIGASGTPDFGSQDLGFIEENLKKLGLLKKSLLDGPYDLRHL